MTQEIDYSDYRHQSLNRSVRHLVSDRSCICILYAGWIRYGRDRIYQSKECRKHYHEESDGFLYRNSRVYLPWIWFIT